LLGLEFGKLGLEFGKIEDLPFNAEVPTSPRYFSIRSDS